MQSGLGDLRHRDGNAPGVGLEPVGLEPVGLELVGFGLVGLVDHAPRFIAVRLRAPARETATMRAAPSHRPAPPKRTWPPRHSKPAAARFRSARRPGYSCTTPAPAPPGCRR